MNLDRLELKYTYYIGVKENKSIKKAIEQENFETIDQMLSSSDTLVETLLAAQQLNKPKVTAYLINHSAFNADMRKQVFAATINSYDSRGDNQAVVLANKISDPVIKQTALEEVDKLLKENTNNAYHQNLEKQLNKIRNALQSAIRSPEPLLESTPIQHPLYHEMDVIFKASERLLSQDNTLPLEQHPLFKYFNQLEEKKFFEATFKSGPTVNDFTELLLGKHGLDLAKANRSGEVNLKIFKNVETFIRCLDIFKKKYEEKTGKTIDCRLSYSQSHTPLDKFCQKYVHQFPELAEIDAQTREKFVRLLSVFNVGNDILDLDITVAMSVKEKDPLQSRSFKPIPANANTFKREQQGGSNEISLGQQNLCQQIQTLNGSQLSMGYIKDADGKEQFKACSHHLHDSKYIKVVDLGGGYGETNAVWGAMVGHQIDLLNIEPHKPCTKPYENAHRAVGIQNVKVIEQKAELVPAEDVIQHFQNEQVDCLFASHFFYGSVLGDFVKATLNALPLNQHPLWKYVNMLRDDGVFVVTLQSGAGARLFRNALLGNHGLNPLVSPTTDASLSLLSSFGNLATFLRHFEAFKEQYQKVTNSSLDIKMHLGVANVPLGSFKVEQDPETQGYTLINPSGENNDKNWLAPTMLDFYGNWYELEFLATLTLEKATFVIEQAATDESLKRKFEILKAKSLLNPTLEKLEAQRKPAREMQETFLHILRVFAPGEENMQHPNVTLEITKRLLK